MKVDRSKLKKSSSEVPGDCGWLIEKLQKCSNEELLPVLRSVESWNYGKCELYHWIDVLDRFDTILEEAAQKDEDKWVLPCDLPENSHVQELVVWVLHFTTLLVEHSFSRHLYSSVEHLITLLSSTSMTIVLAVLNLLYMFSKRSNFITRLAVAPRQALLMRLINLAEPWGGKDNGFGLAQCCQDLPLSSFPENATTLHYEFYGEHQQQPQPVPQQQASQQQQQQQTGDSSSSSSSSSGNRSNNSIITIHIDNMQNISKSPAQVMEELLQMYKVPVEKQMILFTHIRLAHSFGSFETRLQCVQARLQALSVLVYCNALQDNANTVLYSGLLDEFVEVLEINDPKLTEIKAATLRTLTSIIHLDRMPSFPNFLNAFRLNTIIDVTGASSYHGFLPVLVRSCISSLTATNPPVPNPFPAPLATALFSFLYHLASYEAGGEALVSCGMMESLISVVNWKGTEPDHITFVTRAVRVIDLITNLDMHAFQTHGGLTAFIRRLEVEVDECRKEQPFVISLPAPLAENDSVPVTAEGGQPSASEREGAESAETAEVGDAATPSPMDTTESYGATTASYQTGDIDGVRPSTSAAVEVPASSRPDYSEAKTGLSCLPQRAALVKSMLNFLKKAIQEPGFSESMRHLMEGSLPASLKHIISNAEYYGASLFLLATDVVTVYVFGEPSLLSSLQDNGLTDVVLHALLVKDVPATREVLGSLPNVFSALCLNSRGLAAFVACKPFERLFKVLLSPDYLPAMRRRRSSDPMGDTASNLGNAMDELMRHQPSLKAQAMKAIVKLLEEVCLLGSDTHYICWKTPPKHEASPAPVMRTHNDNSSDEEEEEEEEREAGVAGPSVSTGPREDVPPTDTVTGEKRPVPLVDYVLNVMKFVDAILSNNSTDDHCKEFVTQKGLVPLLGILGLPNLPIDFPVSQACQSVASVCKSILNLAHESGVLQRGLQCLHEKLEALAPLHEPLPAPGGSVLLRELASAPTPGEATAFPQATPLLHTLSAVHAYIMMLVHVCRTGQTEIRQVSINQWGTDLGLRVLAGLTKLYTSLVWESTVLLALCSDDGLPAGSLFGKEDTEKLLPPDLKGEEGSRSESVAMEVTESNNTRGLADAGTPLGDVSSASDSPTRQQSAATQHQMKLIKPLLSSASRLGKALAELFGLLVKLCVGSPLRQRRGQQVATPLTPPSTAARAVASALANLLHAGLSWTPPPASPLPKFRLTFLICSVRFTNPMLFDDKKMPYHLMIQYFMSSQGLNAFFDTFEWAISASSSCPDQEGTDSEELPEGTGEFLDTWLFLLERLVNPRTMLDSPHALPAKSSQPGYQPFSPLKFLIHIQKVAFDAVMKLWNKKKTPLKSYGVRISESVLVILCNIIKSEAIIQERLAKEKEAPNNSTALTSTTTTNPVVSNASASASGTVTSLAAAAAAEPATQQPPPVEPDVNPQHLQALMDMGFGRDRCMEAITQTNTLQQATEYLLMNPVDQVGAQVNSGEMELTEEDQMLQAIAMSLGEDVQLTGPTDSRSTSATSGTAPQPTVSAPKLPPPKEVDDEPLSKSTLDKFCECVLEGCLSQLDVQPQMVYKVCELLTTCATRNGSDWREHMLTTLINEISTQASQLLASGSLTSPETVEQLCSSVLASKFAVRLHLVTLLFEEMKRGCAGAMERAGLVDTLTELFTLTHAVMAANPPPLPAAAATTTTTTTTTTPAVGNSTSSVPLTTPSLIPAPCALPSNTGGPSQPKDKDKDKEKDKDENEISGTPKWLSPGLLLLDLYEKLAIATQRRSEVNKICNHVWKWFDVNTLKWCAYSASNNKTIDDAYWSGEASVRIINGRRKYTIQFHSMVQVNEESGNRRPVMITIKEKTIAEEKKKLPNVMPKDESTPTTEEGSQQAAVKEDVVASAEDGDKTTTETSEALSLNTTFTATEDVQEAAVTVAGGEEKMECEESDDTTATMTAEVEAAEVAPIDGLNRVHHDAIIKACVGFMKLGVDPDTLHALMRLCLRVTRVWEQACLFASLGGVRTLLSLTESSGFWGFHSLAALLMRHILEEPTTLRYTMEKVIRSSASNNTMSGAKELHYLLRLLAPAACRDPQLFTEITQQCLRIDLNMTLKRNLMSANCEDSILMKSIGGKSVGAAAAASASGTTGAGSSSSSSSGMTLGSEPQQLIHDLLEALTTLSDDSDSPAPSGVNQCSLVAAIVNATTTPTEERGASSGASSRRQVHLSRSSSANDMIVQETDEQSPMESDSSKIPGASTKAATNDKADEAAKKKKPLLSKSLICKLLAEFVRSYAGCAKLVTEHHYSAGSNEKITEDCSALAYMLDHLVCSSSVSDKDTAGHVRVLIAALASCNHAPDAQTILVTEVKGALARATIVFESAEKHARIQALVGLICTMMEACPAQLNQPANLCFKQQQHHGMNNMIRVMVRKGLVTDLARIPHSLDLSSPNMAATINAALKPLELVSRIVNLPSFGIASSSKKKTPQNDDQQQPMGTETTNSEATRAQGDDNIEDTENTEHDISTAGEILEPSSDAHPNEDGTLVEGDEAGLEEILDQLLDDGNSGSRSQSHRDSVTAVRYVIERDPPMDTDETMHDSGMVTHSESQFLEAEDGGNEEHDDTSSESSDDREEEGDDDDNDEEVEEEEEEEEEEDGADDDDDDEEEEEEGSVFDEGYEDLEETFIRLPGERDTDDILLLPSYQQYIDTIDTIIFGDRVSLHHHGNSHEDPSFMTSTPNANPSGSNIIPTHPLFQNPREVPTTGSARLNSRPSRQRGVLRYHTVTPRTHTTTTTILQRLLGPSHRDVLQLTSNLREANPVLFTNPDVRLMPPDPDEFIDMQDHGGTMMNNGGSSASLANVPNALSRWTEETRVLEADSMHDAVTVVKPALMAVLEKYRDAEQSERDKKKKEQEANKPPPASTEGSQGPLVLLQSGDAEMGEATENNQPSSAPATGMERETPTTEPGGQDAAAIFNTASIAESIVESVLGSSSSNLSTTTTPSFSGLLTLLSPVSNSTPTLPIQEPPVSSVPVAAGTTLVGGVPSAPTTPPQTTSVSTLPPFPSPATSTPTVTPPLIPSSVPSLENETPSALSVTDAEMVAALPLPPMGSAPLTQDSVESLSAQEETPMSVSPPEYRSRSPELFTPSGETVSTPPLPQSAPREAWEDPSMNMQQDPSGDQPMAVAPELVMPATGRSAAAAAGQEGTQEESNREGSEAGPSGSSANRPDYSAILGDIEIPEGVDPSFLAALPEDMRQEVIAEQLRLQRVRQRATENTRESNPGSVGEVNPEFLAALPPNIQEEVLAQQRLEQQRQQAARANPDDPMDPVSFLQTLPPSLRQTILADLEDSQFAALPPELAQEAQTLRRQREERNRHVHDHMFSRSGTSLSSILRNTARIGSRLMHSPSWSTSWNLRPSSSGQQVATTSSSKPRGRPLLDHEALTCLLVLLFVDEPKLNTGRLHRVLRYLCHHTPTRDWVIKALLSILERCGDQSQSSSSSGVGTSSSTELSMPMLPVTPEPSSKGSGKKGSGSFRFDPPQMSTPVWRSEARSPAAPSWLSMSMDAALGCRASIFQIQRTQPTGKRTSSAALTSVNIHPQASPLVCRHTLDTLISLAKSFPGHFLPYQGKDSEEKSDSKKSNTCNNSSSGNTSGGAVSKSSKSQSGEPTDFWELLVKLDSVSVSRKGKGLPRTHSGASGNSEEEQKITSLEASALGQLIRQLAHPVVRRSSLLTDRLLRLLALISLGLPETSDSSSSASASSATASGGGTAGTTTGGGSGAVVVPQSSIISQQLNENTSTLEHLLKLAIQVLTSKSCSEEGLEDATALLLHLSHGPPPARDQVLRLLLQGAATLGSTVATHIAALLRDLKAHNAAHPAPPVHDEEPMPSHVADKSKKGQLQDRFTNECVIISGTTKVKPPCELQLASMSSLTSKTSSQAFFLRTLKVIIQLRDAIRLSRTRKNAAQAGSNNTDRSASNNQAPANAEASESQEGIESSRNDGSQLSLQVAPADTPMQSDSSDTPMQPASEVVSLQVAPAESGEQHDTGQTEQPAAPPQQQQPDVITPPAVTLDVPNPDADNAANASALPSEDRNQSTTEAMDVDNEVTETTELGSLSAQLSLDELWSTLSECLVELGETPDTHAVLVLQPAVEAFFLVHASAASGDKKERATTQAESREAQLAHLQHEIAPLSPLPWVLLDDGEGTGNAAGVRKRENSMSMSEISPDDTDKFLKFAEKHRTVLNQILRQSTVHLADGPFSVLVDHTRLLDFDIKRKYFRTELERADDGMRREDLAVHVRREHVFEDSFRELHRRSPDEWKNRFYIVFEGEEGQDAGGLLREWYMIISREIFNPMYALFCTSPGDRVTYMINPASHCNSNHLSYFKFVGRVIAKAIYDNKLLECYFTRSFYKHILGKMVRVADMESEDYSFYQGLIYLLEHNVADLGYELTFSTEVQEFGVTEVRDLKPNGRNIAVMEESKMEYIRLVCQMKMTGAIRKQLNAFLEGFYDIIPKRLISIFNEQETELLISGLPTIDIDDLRTNTEYHKYQPNSLQIQWFWRALRSFDQAERAKFLQFVTGTSKVPLQGFVALEGMNGTQKFQIHRDDRSTDRLPSAHTCFNQLDLPVYETYDKLRHYLLKAIHECAEGFGFA